MKIGSRHHLIIHLSSFNQLQSIELYAFIQSTNIIYFSVSNTPQILETWNSSLRFIDTLANMIEQSQNFHFHILIKISWANKIDANIYEEMQDRIANNIKMNMPCINAKGILHVQFLKPFTALDR